MRAEVFAEEVFAEFIFIIFALFGYPKLAAYGIERENLRLIYSYLKGWKKCVKVNNTYNDYNEIFSGVPQRSIFEPGLFSLSTNDVFFFFEIASPCNFADNNTASAWGNSF